MDDIEALGELLRIGGILAEHENEGPIPAAIASIVVMHLGMLIHHRDKPLSPEGFNAVIHLVTALRDDIMT